MRARERTPVVIVGAGPTGLAAAAFLGRHGVDSIVFERRCGINPHPRAHVVNTRTMELLRHLDLEERVVDAALPPERSRGAVLWVDSLAGEILGGLSIVDDLEHMQRRLAASPTLALSCAQDQIEPLLLDAALATGHADVRFSAGVSAVEAATHDDTPTVVRTDTGEVVDARYVIAADGAGSPTRKQLGIDMDGEPIMGRQVSIYFTADLTDVVRDRPAILYWIMHPDAFGLLIAMDGRSRWLLNVQLDEDSGQSEADFTTDHCLDLVRLATGAPDVDFTIHSVKPWTMTAQVARRYRVGDVLLAGDAAHRFPPTGGFGMNTGIQDAHNLAWKIAAVEHGFAGSGLLSTYESERRPVAVFNAEQSARNARRANTTMGPGGGEIARRLAEARSPRERGAVLEFLRAEIAADSRHFDFLGQDLGFRYIEGALVGDATAPPQVDDAVRDFVPVARPGHRFPHFWVDLNGKRMSTLDVVEGGWTLVLGPDAGHWVEATRINTTSAPSIRTLTIGTDLVPEDPGEPNRVGIPASGAVLVRPDGHVAFRCFENYPAAGTRLARALESVLSQRGTQQ